MTTHVVAVNRQQEVALLSSGETVPVVAWFDKAGDDCESEDAITCAAGADGIGWWTIDLSEFEPRTSH